MPDRDVRAADVGTWLFLASLVMFYGALFSGYVLLRAGSTTWDTPWLTVTAPWRVFPFPLSQTIWLAGAGAAVWRWRVGYPRGSGQQRAIFWWLPLLATFMFTADWVNMAGALTAAGHGPPRASARRAGSCSPAQWPWAWSAAGWWRPAPRGGIVGPRRRRTGCACSSATGW